MQPANIQKKAPVSKLDPPGPSIKNEATEIRVAVMFKNVEFFKSAP